MSYSPELIEEINLLALYNISSIQEGIKVHKAEIVIMLYEMFVRYP